MPRSGMLIIFCTANISDAEYILAFIGPTT
jgi:hypothetical protein